MYTCTYSFILSIQWTVEVLRLRRPKRKSTRRIRTRATYNQCVEKDRAIISLPSCLIDHISTLCALFSFRFDISSRLPLLWPHLLSIFQAIMARQSRHRMMALNAAHCKRYRIRIMIHIHIGDGMLCTVLSISSSLSILE